MGAIADIFRQYGNAYIDAYAGRIPYAHIKTIRSIQKCRTLLSGINLYKCKDCKVGQFIYRSCGSRNCPNCQKQKTQHWLDMQLNNALPGHHFLVTFTIPAQLRPFFRTTQAGAYSALFAASSDALRQLMADPKYIGCDLPGFFGILHTWGRQLAYHPHVHFIVPGGGIDRKTKTWMQSPKGFLVSVHALSKLFKGKLKAIFKAKGLLDKIDPAVWKKDFVVNSEAVGDSPEGALKYLAPYVYKIAVSDSRIISCKNDKVTFTYKKKGSDRHVRLTLNVFEFIRRYLQHVLPSGFMKVRYYGFMSPSCKLPILHVRSMVECATGCHIVVPFVDPLDDKSSHPHAGTTDKIRAHLCDACGGTMEHCQTIMPYEMTMT